MSKFLHNNDNGNNNNTNDTKAIAIPPVFSKNSLTNKEEYLLIHTFRQKGMNCMNCWYM